MKFSISDVLLGYLLTSSEIIILLPTINLGYYPNESIYELSK